MSPRAEEAMRTIRRILFNCVRPMNNLVYTIENETTLAGKKSICLFRRCITRHGKNTVDTAIVMICIFIFRNGISAADEWIRFLIAGHRFALLTNMSS